MCQDRDDCVQCCGGPPFRIQYADSGEPLINIPMSVYKRNGLQDNVYTELGVSRRICKSDAGPCCCTVDKNHPKQHDHHHKDRRDRPGTKHDECWSCVGHYEGKMLKRRVQDDHHVTRTVYNTPGCDGDCSWKKDQVVVPTFGGCLYKEGCREGEQVNHNHNNDHDQGGNICPCCRRN